MNIQQFCAGYGIEFDFYLHDPQKVHENNIHLFFPNFFRMNFLWIVNWLCLYAYAKPKEEKKVHTHGVPSTTIRALLSVCLQREQMEIFGGTKRERTDEIVNHEIVREKPRGFYLLHMSVMMFSHKTNGEIMTGILDRNNLIYACETK